jgi:hypothetical protein
LEGLMFPVPPWLASIALKLTPFGQWLKTAFAWVLRFLGLQVSLRVWMVAVALLVGWHWHSGAVRRSVAANDALWKAKFDRLGEESRAIADRTNRATAKIAEALRSRTDEENLRIAADADALRVSGPGKAVCTGHAGLSAATGGREQSAPLTDAARPPLPTDERAAVPWLWLTGRGQEHDDLLTEVKAWRAWHDEVLKVWPSLGS